jgi:hypothetical protein
VPAGTPWRFAISDGERPSKVAEHDGRFQRLLERRERLRERALRLDALRRLGDGGHALGLRRDRFARGAESPRAAADARSSGGRARARARRRPSAAGGAERAASQVSWTRIARRRVVADEPAREPMDPGGLGEQGCGIDRRTGLFGALHEAIMPPRRERWPNPVNRRRTLSVSPALTSTGRVLETRRSPAAPSSMRRIEPAPAGAKGSRNRPVASGEIQASNVTPPGSRAWYSRRKGFRSSRRGRDPRGGRRRRRGSTDLSARELGPPVEAGVESLARRPQRERVGAGLEVSTRARPFSSRPAPVVSVSPEVSIESVQPCDGRSWNATVAATAHACSFRRSRSKRVVRPSATVQFHGRLASRPRC